MNTSISAAAVTADAAGPFLPAALVAIAFALASAFLASSLSGDPLGDLPNCASSLPMSCGLVRLTW